MGNTTTPIAKLAGYGSCTLRDLQPNDVITAIDNQPLKQESNLAKIINSHKPEDANTLTVLRGNQTLNLQLKLGQNPNT